MAKKETHRLYQGEVELTFEPGRHRYRVTDPRAGLVQDWVPSVTGVLGVINKPALVGWAANMAADYVEERLKPYIGKPLDEVELAEIVREARAAYRRRRDKAADLGTIIHNWIEGHIKSRLGLGDNPGVPNNPTIRAVIDQFLAWEQEHDVVYLASEARLYSRSLRLVGTADILMVFTDEDGKRHLEVADVKTGEAIYPEYTLQIGAYIIMAEESRLFAELTKKAGVEIDLTQEIRGRVIRIGREGTGFEAPLVVRDEIELDDVYSVLSGAVFIYSWLREQQA